MTERREAVIADEDDVVKSSSSDRENQTEDEDGDDAVEGKGSNCKLAEITAS